jgi:hypothetical protein
MPRKTPFRIPHDIGDGSASPAPAPPPASGTSSGWPSSDRHLARTTLERWTRSRNVLTTCPTSRGWSR